MTFNPSYFNADEMNVASKVRCKDIIIIMTSGFKNLINCTLFCLQNMRKYGKNLRIVVWNERYYIGRLITETDRTVRRFGADKSLTFIELLNSQEKGAGKSVPKRLYRSDGNDTIYRINW